MIGEAVEQAGVQLEDLAVGIDVGAGKPRPQERRAQLGSGAEQAVDLAVLETAQLLERQTQLPQHARWIDLPAVGRRDHQRQGAGIRMEHLDRRTKLGRHRRRRTS